MRTLRYFKYPVCFMFIIMLLSIFICGRIIYAQSPYEILKNSISPFNALEYAGLNTYIVSISPTGENITSLNENIEKRSISRLALMEYYKSPANYSIQASNFNYPADLKSQIDNILAPFQMLFGLSRENQQKEVEDMKGITRAELSETNINGEPCYLIKILPSRGEFFSKSVETKGTESIETYYKESSYWISKNKGVVLQNKNLTKIVNIAGNGQKTENINTILIINDYKKYGDRYLPTGFVYNSQGLDRFELKLDYKKVGDYYLISVRTLNQFSDMIMGAMSTTKLTYGDYQINQSLPTSAFGRTSG